MIHTLLVTGGDTYVTCYRCPMTVQSRDFWLRPWAVMDLLCSLCSEDFCFVALCHLLVLLQFKLALFIPRYLTSMPWLCEVFSVAWPRPVAADCLSLPVVAINSSSHGVRWHLMFRGDDE